MKTPHLLVTCVLGLSAGGLAGYAFRAGDVHASSATAKAASGARLKAAAANGGLTFPEEDARITRLFSALQEPVWLRRRAELFEALHDLTPADLPALVTHVEALGSASGAELLDVLIERWFEVDFDSAVAWMRAHRNQGLALKAWARQNPEAAIHEAIAAPEDRQSQLLLGYAIDHLGGADAAAKLAKLRTLPAGKLRDAGLLRVLPELAKSDPTAALDALREITSSRERDQARKSILIGWIERDPAQALAHVEALLPTLEPHVLGNDLIIGIADRLAAKDPRGALEWLSGIPEEFRIAPAIAAAGLWAKTEPVAALEWCMANGVDVARGRRWGFTMSTAGVLDSAVSHSPDATIAWLDGLPAGFDRDRLLERALSWALHELPKERQFERGAVAMRLFQALPEEGQARMATNLGETRGEQENLTDLKAWAQTFPPGAARANAVAGALGAVYERDASRVEPLLAGVSGADHDAALRGLARVMSRTVFRDAAMRALEIRDTGVRYEALNGVITTWLAREPEAGRAWLQNASTLPVAWKQEWLRAK